MKVAALIRFLFFQVIKVPNEQTQYREKHGYINARRTTAVGSI